jgi:hypothetical protein
MPEANSFKLFVPMRMAPAFFILATIVASIFEILLDKIFEPAVHLTPSAEIISLIENGIPCNGPRSIPCVISFSDISASLYARSVIILRKEFKVGLNS